jgi:hypothetical protein
MLAMEPRAVEAVWSAIDGHLTVRPPTPTRWDGTGHGSRTATA